MSPGLLLMGILAIRWLRDGFSIRDLRNSGLHSDLLLVPNAVKDNVDMKFAHTRDDRLLCLRVESNRKGRILFGSALKKLIHLVFIFLAFSGHRDRVDGLRNF